MYTFAELGKSRSINIKTSRFLKHMIKTTMEYKSGMTKVFAITEKICLKGYMVTDQQPQHL